jgi:lactate permease
LVTVVTLLVLLAVFRISAWLAVLIGSIVTFLLGLWVWKMPIGDGVLAYVYGSATGVWNVDWITFWGVMLFNTLTVTVAFDKFRRWLISQGTQDIRVQTMLFAWALGALLEGLVGFGYPWAFVAPILITLGIPDLEAVRVAAISNNAPVSYGALGVPTIALAAVTVYPLNELSASVGHVVAILALPPPRVLIYLVSGKEGLKDGWPLAVVGSLGYIAGQFLVAVYLGPYLPDVTGAIVSFGALLLLLKCWRPKRVLSFGGRPVPSRKLSTSKNNDGITRGEIFQTCIPIITLVVVVVAWTGPCSSLPHVRWFHAAVTAHSSVAQAATITAAFDFKPGSGGTAILVSWIIVALLLGVGRQQLLEI